MSDVSIHNDPDKKCKTAERVDKLEPLVVQLAQDIRDVHSYAKSNHKTVLLTIEGKMRECFDACDAENRKIMDDFEDRFAAIEARLKKLGV